MKKKQQHGYNICFRKNDFEIAFTVEAQNKRYARLQAFYLIQQESLVPKTIKDKLHTKDIIVERIWKHKRTD